ncbi:MAG: DnaD domain protein [Chloroflexi bacterium]|nr:DnaD domain protein [Chloroflexota bacterium]
MKEFFGFPANTRYTPVPNSFIVDVLPEIDDIEELKATLQVMWALTRKRGSPRYITFSELRAQRLLMVAGEDEAETAALRHGLVLALLRRTLLGVVLDRGGKSEEAFLLNTRAGRQEAARLAGGQVDLPEPEQEPVAPESLNIFALYERNIGILTPMVVDELREAEKLYPESWIEEAFKEAAVLNKRSWRYVARILERWATEGKDDGTVKRHPKAAVDPDDPDKYWKGRYGHLARS